MLEKPDETLARYEQELRDVKRDYELVRHGMTELQKEVRSQLAEDLLASRKVRYLYLASYLVVTSLLLLSLNYDYIFDLVRSSWLLGLSLIAGTIPLLSIIAEAIKYEITTIKKPNVKKVKPKKS